MARQFNLCLVSVKTKPDLGSKENTRKEVGNKKSKHECA